MAGLPSSGGIPPSADRAQPAYGAHLLAYAGIPSFMRRPATRELAGADVAIVGVPYDGGATSYRSGARLGPRQIRAASTLLWGYNAALGVAPLEVLRLIDYGDVAVQPGDTAQTMGAIAQESGVLLAAGLSVVALGGDHSITLPLLRAHAARYGPLAVLHLDAHADTWAGPPDHSTTFRHAIEEGLIAPASYVLVGMRGPLWAAEDAIAPRELGALVWGADECLTLGIPAVVASLREHLAGRPLYVSLDLDAADPAYAPGVGTPEIGGLTSHQLLQLVRGLRGLRLIGADVVELCPPYDHGDITAVLAANLVFELLSLLALQLKGQQP